MDNLVLLLEQLRVEIDVSGVQNAEPSTDMTVVRQVCSVLHTALKHHIAKFNFLSRANLQLKELVTTLFKVNARHDDQIDCFAQLN